MASPLDAEEAYYVALETARERSAALVGPSLIDRIVALPTKARDDLLAELAVLDLARLRYDWEAWARPKQNPHVEFAFRILFWLMGRGAGKTTSAAQRIRKRVVLGARTIGLIGPTIDDIERYMLGRWDDEEGLLNIFPPSQRPTYIADKGIVEFHTGAVGYVHSAEKPQFRGPNLDTVWLDEIAMFRFLSSLWANIEMATRRAGPLPVEILVTTTPRPMQFIKDLIGDADCFTIIGLTEENWTNVDQGWLDRMRKRYGGTRLGAQELEAEVLGDNPDSLFPGSVTDATRVESEPDGLRTVVSVDPAIATEPKNDETGIIVMGDDLAGHMYVLADVSGRHKPEVWGKLVIDAYDKHDAIAIVVERNRGGDLVESNVRAAMERRRGGVAAKALRIEDVHASKGKTIRAEPVSALHAKGMLHFVGRMMKTAEIEIGEWNPTLGGASPNRLDAIVWGAYFLGNLSSEEKRDPMIGIRGLGAVNAILQRPRPEQATTPSAVSRSPATAQRRAVARTVPRRI